jgi:hypothetical protein
MMAIYFVHYNFVRKRETCWRGRQRIRNPWPRDSCDEARERPALGDCSLGYQAEATSGDYDHLLQTAMRYVDCE